MTDFIWQYLRHYKTSHGERFMHGTVVATDFEPPPPIFIHVLVHSKGLWLGLFGGSWSFLLGNVCTRFFFGDNLLFLLLLWRILSWFLYWGGCLSLLLAFARLFYWLCCWLLCCRWFLLCCRFCNCRWFLRFRFFAFGGSCSLGLRSCLCFCFCFCLCTWWGGRCCSVARSFSIWQLINRCKHHCCCYKGLESMHFRVLILEKTDHKDRQCICIWVRFRVQRLEGKPIWLNNGFNLNVAESKVTATFCTAGFKMYPMSHHRSVMIANPKKQVALELPLLSQNISASTLDRRQGTQNWSMKLEYQNWSTYIYHQPILKWQIYRYAVRHRFL